MVKKTKLSDLSLPKGESEIRRNAGGRTQRRPRVPTDLSLPKGEGGSVSLGIENAKQSQFSSFSIKNQRLPKKQTQFKPKT
jgi:hypothetical protein